MKRLALSAMATFGAIALPTAASAATLVVDVTGTESYAAFGSPSNTVRTYDIGANSRITGVSYNVTITAFSPSWLSEARLAFTNTNLDGVFLTPGFQDTDSGTMTYVSSADLVELDLDFAVASDGILRLEYYESFTDGLSPDAVWDSGTITFTYEALAEGVPEPSTWAMLILGFGVVGGSLRSRRRVNMQVSMA